MENNKLIKVKGKIIEKYDLFNFTVYAEEFESEIKVTASGKMAMVYHKELIIGSEIIIEVNPYDKTKGRVARRALDFWTYEKEREQNSKD